MRGCNTSILFRMCELNMREEQIWMSRSNKENYEENFATTYPKTSLLYKHIYNLSFSLGKAMQHLPKEPNTLLDSVSTILNLDFIQHNSK